MRFKSTVLGLICLLSCFGGLISANESRSTFFPQNVGDEHAYRRTGLGGATFEWTDKILESNGRFFSHSNYWGDGVERRLRVTGNKKVVEQSGRKPLLWYRFDINDKKDWTMRVSGLTPSCVDDSQLQVVNRDATVTVPAGTFTRCLELGFISKCSDAGVTRQWFAPDVGLVKQVELTIGGPITVELLRAKVGTTTFPQ